jgi:hypothetical protein
VRPHGLPSGWSLFLVARGGQPPSRAGNDHLFALLDQIEQLADPVFRLEGADLPHGKLQKSS